MRHISFLDLNKIHESLKPALNDAFVRVMNSGWFIMGPELEAFEAEFAVYSNVKYCVGVGNGLDALHLLLRAYDIGPGDEVIVPSNTFIATWLAVSQCGARPVPVEPRRDTHNLDPELIEQAITKKTRAIIPVHLYGQTADMDPINVVAKKHGLVVIEDSAQAQGALYKGRSAGSLGDAAATSFYPGKNLGAFGDGGAVLTSDKTLADRVRKLRSYGSTVKYVHDVPGYNSRLDELQAAFLRAKLQRLNEFNEARRKCSALYSHLLSSANIGLPSVPDFAEPVWHLFVVTSDRRDALKTHLDRLGVSTVIHYPIPPHLQECYRGGGNYQLPIAESLARSVLSLPITSAFDEADIQYIADAILEFPSSLS
jgi:dTDP-4-amino-4,6-dideoxygalactose transaminase